MHLHHIRTHNFRAFGDGTTAPALDWKLNPGMNILIGENDAGKTSIIDAIRFLLWTTSFEAVRLQEQDFFVRGTSRADTLVIEATFRDLSPTQEAAVLEWLTYEADGSRSLVLSLQARRQLPQPGRRQAGIAISSILVVVSIRAPAADLFVAIGWVPNAPSPFALSLSKPGSPSTGSGRTGLSEQHCK